MSDVYQDAASVLRSMDKHHQGLRDAFYNRPAIKSLRGSVMKQSFALVCKASRVSDKLKDILVLGDLVPKTYKWDGTRLGSSRYKGTNKTPSAVPTDVPKTDTDAKDCKLVTIGWSKKRLRATRHDSMSQTHDDDSNEESDPYLYLVMVYDLLYGQGISSGGVEAKLIRSKATELKELMTKRYGADAVDVAESTAASAVLRYLRVNTCRVKVGNALKAFDQSLKNENKERETGNGGATERRLSRDPLVKSVIQIHQSDAVAQLVQHQLVVNGSVVFQDRASCLSALVANIQPGMTIMDVCAAPGSKTIHAIDLLKGSGCMMAIEKDARRAKVLIQRLKLCFNLDGPYSCPQCLTAADVSTPAAAAGSPPAQKKRKKQHKEEETEKDDQGFQKLFLVQRGGSKKLLTVIVMIGDFLKLDKETLSANSCSNKKCSGSCTLNTKAEIDVMLVDPSCSGSGLQVNPYSAQVQMPEKEPGRVKALASFQKRILSHALLTFCPSVLCYSTCSIYIGENEAVVNEVLNSNGSTDSNIQLGKNYKVEHAAPFWETVSETEYKDKYLNAWKSRSGNAGDDEGVARSIPGKADCQAKLSQLFDICFHSNPFYDQCRGFFLAKICRTSETNVNS